MLLHNLGSPAHVKESSSKSSECGRPVDASAEMDQLDENEFYLVLPFMAYVAFVIFSSRKHSSVLHF